VTQSSLSPTEPTTSLSKASSEDTGNDAVTTTAIGEEEED
jgi:hypothetical protein